MLDAEAQWQDAPLRDWRTFPDQRLAKFTGNVWLSNHFDLSEKPGIGVEINEKGMRPYAVPGVPFFQ